MRRVLFTLAAFALVLPVSQLASASVPQPMCGPPGEEVPATIVGAGNINGTPGDDVIVGSPGVDHINGGPGSDIICAEAGNDVVTGGSGADVLIGDGEELPPFAPSNGNNDDWLDGGSGNDEVVGLGGNDTLIGGPGSETLNTLNRNGRKRRHLRGPGTGHGVRRARR